MLMHGEVLEAGGWWSDQVITSTKEVMFQVCLYVFQQDFGKTTGLIFMKPGGRE